MTRGISIHVGLNNVDTSAYPGVIVPVLAGCINDANDMRAIADAQGFESSELTDSQATADAITTAISNASGELADGDILLVSFSGHGSQIPDSDGEEEDALDETWVTYDRMLIDDELYSLWSKFAAGVRIFVCSDSCHSGTVARMLVTRLDAYRELVTLAQSSELSAVKDLIPVSPVREMLTSREVSPAAVAVKATMPEFRGIPADLMISAYEKRHDLYASIKARTPRTRDVDVAATVILISGCQDNQTSLDGSGNGLFTENLKAVWDNGGYSGEYRGFHDAILAKMPASQSPNYFVVGAGNSAFEAQKPFTIDASASSSTTDTNLDGGTVAGTGDDPTVSGPARCARSDDPPTFEVHPGAVGPYYVFEAATRPELFDSSFSAQRTASSWYASWDDNAAESRMTSDTYQLPAGTWSQLNGADRLYYRIGATSSSDPNTWSDYVVSTADADGANAPWIEISD